MPFNRPPRIQPNLPGDRVEVPPPANPPSKPGALNALSIGLPLGAVLLTVMLMSSGGGAASYLRFLPIMLATYLATGLTYAFGMRNYKRQLAEAREAYDRKLTEIEGRLDELQSATQKALNAVDPGPAECLARARSRDARLGERRPSDPDFLAIRFGLGEAEPTYQIEATEIRKPIAGFEERLQRAEQIVRKHRLVPQAPIRSDLSRLGSLGIVGSAEQAASLARAMICQLATHHWPSEVQIAAVTTPGQAEEWAWLEELPHAAGLLGSGLAATSEDSRSAWMSRLEKELQQREQLLETRRASGGAPSQDQIPLPRLAVLIQGLSPDFKHPGLTMLLKEGRRLGAHALFLAPRPESLPGECGAVLLIRDGTAHYRETGANARKVDCRADGLGRKEASEFASSMASIDWPLGGDLSTPPALIRLSELLGSSEVDQLPMEAWWDGEPPFGYLRVPIGRQSATADLVFDLNDQDGSHGPHGLIGGMTGSGKSEVLKTILLALAATHSPYELNFALIDYKGGAAFNELTQLPHTVGIVTDIETHATYAERVIQALAGEIEHRKRILERTRATFGFGRSHIDEYRKLRVKRPLPRLIIVFDEFAEFKHRNPEESKRLISIARQGRSLGVHLILATQNIEAAVDPEILQNSTFRICLRVSQAQDSVQMIGIPDAVSLPRGRAYFQAQTRHIFQVGYSGGEYQARPQANRPKEIVRISRAGDRQPIALPGWAADGRSSPPIASEQYTEAQALVDRIVETARSLRLRKPLPVWPDPLPERLYLPDLVSKHLQGGWTGSGWLPARARRAEGGTARTAAAILGLIDQPEHQTQLLFTFDPESGGQHLLVFGSASSGKSTFLRTLASSLMRNHSPAEAVLYVLDFGGQAALKPLEKFPHVGAVVTRLEEERVLRSLAFLQKETVRRNELLRAAGVDNCRDFNSKAGPEARLPALFVLVDGFGELKRLMPVDWIRSLGSLVSGGAAIGLHLIVSAALQADLPNELFANIPARVTFHLADQSEYFRIVGRPSEAKLKQDIERPPPAGRGLVRGTPPHEFQAALPVAGQTDEEQARALAALAAQMNLAWQGPRPSPIEILPVLIPWPRVQDRQPGEFRREPTWVVGVEYDTLLPASLDLRLDGPTLLIASVSPQAGKTTLLRSSLLGLLESAGADELQVVLLDFHARSMTLFKSIPHRHAYVGTGAGLEPTFEQLTREVQRRQRTIEKAYEQDPDRFDADEIVAGWPPILVVVDDYDRFSGREPGVRKLLAEALASGGELGLSFLISGNINELPRDYDDPFMQAVRKHGNGVLLGGTEGIEQFNNARRPPGPPAAGLPAGRGYLVRRGQARLVQTVAYWQEGEEPDRALAARIRKLRD